MTAPVIRTLTLPEIETLVSWAAAEGWNPGPADAAAFHAADPDGFLGAFVDGEMAAGISAVAYGETFGFIGLYIAKPEFRGRGIGRTIWDAGMKRLEGRTVGLDGVPEQQSNYRSLGFVDAYQSVRLSGRPSLPATRLNVIDGVSIEDALALDRLCFPAPRESFLRAWLKPPRIVRAVTDGNGLRGYGVIRPCIDGHKIGPLFADDLDVAIAILGSLIDAVDGAVQIDAPLSNPRFTHTLLAAGMTPGFSTARMYRGQAPRLHMNRVFGVTTLELG